MTQHNTKNLYFFWDVKIFFFACFLNSMEELVTANAQHLAWITATPTTHKALLAHFSLLCKRTNLVSSSRLSNQPVMSNSMESTHKVTPMSSSHANHHFRSLLCHWKLLYRHITTKHKGFVFLSRLCNSTLTAKTFRWWVVVYLHLVYHLSPKRLLRNPGMLWPLWRFPWVAFQFC